MHVRSNQKICNYMPKYASIAVLASVPNFITAMASSVVRLPLESSALSLATASRASILNCFLSGVSFVIEAQSSKYDSSLVSSSNLLSEISIASFHA